MHPWISYQMALELRYRLADITGDWEEKIPLRKINITNQNRQGNFGSFCDIAEGFIVQRSRIDFILNSISALACNLIHT
jgi:hypothetical protein